MGFECAFKRGVAFVYVSKAITIYMRASQQNLKKNHFAITRIENQQHKSRMLKSTRICIEPGV